MAVRNRQWLLKQRPIDAVAREHFLYCERNIDEPSLEAGQVWVRNLVFNCAPTMRNWMNAAERSYRTPIGVGEAIAGPACSRVLKSANACFTAGSLLIGVSRWEDYSLLEPELAATPVLSVPADVTPTDALGIYGLNSLTAYMGLFKVAQPTPNDTVVVSAAAGSVGSMAVQLAKLHGCHVIGIAGGVDKCRWLLDSCGADGAIDYKSESVASRLVALAPHGVNVFFDNVGGELLQTVTEHMAVHGRIVLCGQLSAYNSDAPAPGPRDMMRVVYRRLTLQGFVLGDYRDEVESARAKLQAWHLQGKLQRHDDVRRGFAQLPAAFLDLFSGANRGTVLVEVAENSPDPLYNRPVGR